MAIVSFTNSMEQPNYMQKAMENYRRELERQYQAVYSNQLGANNKYKNQVVASS